MKKSALVSLIVLVPALFAPAQAPTSGSLRQIEPGHYAYSENNNGMIFNSGVIVRS